MKPNFQKRRDAILRKLKRLKIPALLVTNELNVTYLTGFTGDSTYLWLGKDKTLLLSDTRYTTQLAEECPEIEGLIRDASSTQIDAVANLCKTQKISAVGIESDHLSKHLYDQFSAATPCELIDTQGLVEEARTIKDKFEIDLIRKSVKINERAFSVIRAQLSPNQTEREIAHNLEHQIRQFGGTCCAFDPIVGVGDRSALPHGVPSYKRMEESSFVLIDWGTTYRGYASDLTRVLGTAKIPPKIRKIYDIVLNAQLAAIAKIRPGVSFKAVDAVAREFIHKAGFGKRFGHGLGHGFGLQIHEHPFMNPIRDGEFKQNMVVTVEPGIYLPGVGGVRIEDDILVTKDGHEVLSSLPKELDANIIDI